MCCVISGEDKNNMSRSYNSKCKIGSSINFEISFEENGYTFRGGNSVKNIWRDIRCNIVSGNIFVPYSNMYSILKYLCPIKVYLYAK